MRIYLIIALFLFTSSRAFSAVETYSERVEGAVLVVSSTVPVLTVFDDKYYKMGTEPWQLEFTNYKVTNYTRLGINPDVAQTNNLNGSVDIKIKMWKWNSSTNVFDITSVNQTLAVSYSASNPTAIVDEISTFLDKNAHKVEVYILAINGGENFDVNDVYLTSEIEIERYYNFIGAPVVGINCEIDPANFNYYQFTWAPKIGAEYYELEWVHVSDVSDVNGVLVPVEDIKYNYYLNSTRISVRGTSYKIPRIFDSGYIFYRIRPIGMQGADFSIRNEGWWSNQNESGFYLDHTLSNRLKVNGEYDSQMNWSHQVSYGDNGERFESVSFVDGLGRARQGVTHNTETGQAVVSNVYYDELGRAVISDLPTPVDGENLKHYPNFNLVNGTNVPFMLDYFDASGSTACEIIGGEFSTTSGAGKYYSPDNSNLMEENSLIPDAEKYPYSRVQYKNDFTGRVFKANGVGKELKSGSGHETIFGYASANQTELDHLFGSEVGIASHYQRMVTIDANGQAYVQYMDMAGRTIASALAGQKPDNLDAISGNIEHNATISILPQNAQNVVISPAASSTLTYTEFITQDADYTFNYAFTPKQFKNACLGNDICLDCVYDLTLKVVKVCDGTIEYNNTQTLIGKDIDNLCSDKPLYTVSSLPTNLKVGEYYIVKTLSVNQQAIEDKWCTYIDQTTCDGSISTKFNELYANEIFELCVPESPLEALADNGDCDEHKEMMLADMSPGGQYAIYNTILGQKVGDGIHCVLTENNLGTNKDWRHPSTPYLNEDGTVAAINAVLSTTSLNDFISQFQSSWANSLLSYHPEYCFYEFCLNNQNSTNNDIALKSIYTYAEACTFGCFKPLSINTPPSSIACTNSLNDPFFVPYNVSTIPPFWINGFGASLASQMNDQMNNYAGTGYSIWENAIHQAMSYGNTTQTIATSLASYNALHDRDCFLDLIWVNFRSMYLELKEQMVYQVQNSQVGCSNAQIGTGTWSDKSPRFGNANMLNSVDLDGNGPDGPTDIDTDGSGPDLGTTVDENFINAQITAGCQTSCNQYATDWISQMVGCEQYTNLSQGNKENFKNALITLCMSGCDSEHPTGSTTSPEGSTTPFHSIDEVMASYFGSNYEDNLCTSLLISEPSPYQSTASQFAMVDKPLDVCACEEILTANYDVLHNNNPNNFNLEQMIAFNTGVSLEEANIMVCRCNAGLKTTPYNPINPLWEPNANALLAASGITIPVELACTSGNGCVGFEVVEDYVDLLNTRFENLASLSNYEIILTNYLNNSLLFHLQFSDYETFIAKYLATPANPYCEMNPLLQDWSNVMTLLAYKGEMLNTVSNPINLLATSVTNGAPSNIVYANSDLKDYFVNDNYWSEQTTTTLTTHFGSPTGTNCSLTLSLPADPTFGFADIVAFGTVSPTTAYCPDPNNAFKVKITYLDCGKINYGWLEGTSTCFEVNKCICSPDGLTLCDEIPSIAQSICYQPRLNELYSNSLDAYLENIDAVYDTYKKDFNAACATTFNTESLSFTGPANVYQYTLYFYDQAGNLIKTVAPKGNDPISFDITNVEIARDIETRDENPIPTTFTTPITVYDPPLFPIFTYETEYKYNSYNQLVSTTNPDQDGSTNFWFDGYGRVVASQNPVQKDEHKYSYSLFDVYGRPTEVGQADLDIAPGQMNIDISETVLKTEDNGALFGQWVYACKRTEITYTLYDKTLQGGGIAAKFANQKQENLRLRVASVFYFKSVPTSAVTMPSTGYESASHYSYDLHGNVKEVLQDIPSMDLNPSAPANDPAHQNIKSTQYSYALISGNMKKVEYQKGKRDRMTHEYEYDKLYRLTEVFTSTDAGIHKSREAHYKYYDYGPLARVEIGQHKVQGNDYAYTINGWIKGMNSTTLDKNRDMGKDGAFQYNSTNSRMHETFAKDVVGYSLGYFQNDYKSIGTSNFDADVYQNNAAPAMANEFGTAIKSLYNGNISNSVTAIDGFDILGSAFEYDQLQQLKKMRVFRAANLNSDNSWGSAVETEEYASNYIFDKNGNLEFLNRNATSGAELNMDKFHYNYVDLNGKPSNRLDFVTDGPDATSNATPNISDDIEPGQSASNYKYDKLGQLISDDQEHITQIVWRTGDKKILSQSGINQKMEYIYNPFGQRSLKIVKICIAGVEQSPSVQTPWTYTYYGYDANGQVMSTYKVVVDGHSKIATVEEQNIFGSGRLGLIDYGAAGKLVYNSETTLPAEGSIWVNQLGNKRYELTNHLGNVNAVITDRKVPMQSVASYDLNTFATTTEGWTVTSPTTITQNNGAVEIHVQGTTAGVSNAMSKDFTTLVGQEYDVVVSTSSQTGGSGMQVRVNGLNQAIATGTTSSVSFVATSTLTSISILGAGVGNYLFSVQDVLVVNHISYEAVVIMKADYYPFGMQMPGRNTNSNDYRFGYNGMEKDPEMKGDGNSYTTEFRQYDPRLGRWLSLDPMMMMFPSLSPYVAFDNNPVIYDDPLGLSPDPPVKKSGNRHFKATDEQKADELKGLPDAPKKGDEKHYIYTEGKKTTVVDYVYVEDDRTEAADGHWTCHVGILDLASVLNEHGDMTTNIDLNVVLIAKADPPAPVLNNEGLGNPTNNPVDQAGSESKPSSSTATSTKSKSTSTSKKKVTVSTSGKPTVTAVPTPTPKPKTPAKTVKLDFTNIAFDPDDNELDRVGHYDWGSDDITDLLMPAVKILKENPNAVLTITVGSSLNKTGSHPTFGTVQNMLDARYAEVVRQLKIVYPKVNTSKQLKKVTKGNSKIAFTGVVTAPAQ